MSSQSQDYIPSTQSQETKNNDDKLTEATNSEFSKSKGGRPKKLYNDLNSTSARHDRLRPILDTCLNFCEEQKIPLDKLFGEMGFYHYNSVGDDYLKAKMFGMISKGENPFQKHTMSIPRSLAFKDFCRLGQKPYDEVKALLDPVLKLGRFVIYKTIIHNIQKLIIHSIHLTRLVK